VLSALVAACGGSSAPSATPSPAYLTSIPGAKGHDTPQNAVRGFFDSLVRNDIPGAALYVDTSERQSFTTGFQATRGKQYSLQIRDFQVFGFTGNQTAGTVQLKVDGQACLSGKCTQISANPDSSASIPVAKDSNQWFLTDVSPPQPQTSPSPS
jgi:hypothetical protein